MVFAVFLSRVCVALRIIPVAQKLYEIWESHVVLVIQVVDNLGKVFVKKPFQQL